MKYPITLITCLLVLLTTSSCYKKHTCACTVRSNTTNEIIDTKDFSYRGNDARPQTQKAEDCANTGLQIDAQNNNETYSTCVVE